MELRGLLLTAVTCGLALSLLPSPAQSERILGVMPSLAKSHMVVFSTLTRELARRGHELVVVSAFPLAKPMANYTDINTMPGLETIINHFLGERLYDMAEMAFWQHPLTIYSIGLKVTDAFMSLPEVLNILKDKKGFDLVIVESFLNEAAYGFADHFKAPLVLVSPFGGFHWQNYYHGNPVPASVVPNPMLALTDTMCFTERLTNVLYTLMWDVGNQFYYLPHQDAIRKRVFGESSASVWELTASTSLSLLNNHFSLSYPRPMVPAMVEVGGIHIMRKQNKLPDDIQKFMDEAEHGVIYFSMGSNLRSDQMPAVRRDAFLQAFSELPQRVLWKWESDSLPGQPPNVKLGKWLPQQDILAHPNVRVFMTHGGLLSTQEAAFHGVPLVGIPVFGDQPLNMRKSELAGLGVMVTLKNVTKTSIRWALDKVINDPSYREKARARAAIFRDQPESALDRAVFWTEYVLRHKGAPHLRTAATRLSWYQLYLLDVMAALAAVLLLALLLLRAAVRACCCRGANTPHKPDPKKKKQ